MICSRCKKRPAVVFVTRQEGEKTVNEGFCLVCAKDLGLKPVDDILKRFGIADEDLEVMSNQLFSADPNAEEDVDFEGGGSPALPSMFMGMDGEAPQKNRKNSKKSDEAQKNRFLDKYCDNLTQKARDGKLDRIIGRDKEIYRTLQILSRRQKNNPCLIGEAGVGKTAIAEGIALRIVSGDVPARMLDKEVYLLDLTSLVAGTQFRGQFEGRVKELVNEVKKAGNVILFIDEVHNLTGAGESEGGMNAANILKPALSRGEIQVIGATTFAEYRKYIEKDQALERRFQPVRIEEPSIEDTVEVLRGIKEYYENFHHVKIDDDILDLIVRLSERYVTDRFLPDKAIDLLDEAAACRAIRSGELTEYEELQKKTQELTARQKLFEQKTEPTEKDFEESARLKSELLKLEQRQGEIRDEVENLHVTRADLSKVIELWTGIPGNKIEQSEYAKIAGLEEAMKKRIIGQDEAVKAVSDAIKRTRIGLNTRRRPASFIFVGPTGVGKTELVKVLATELFDSVDPLIRIDMSEYMEKHTVARLIGSPPGYVGYDEAGQLTEKVRRRPYSVVLFDEIEKAHPDVMNVLLQILDEGRVTDAQGRTVNFEHTVICMTSNAGSSDRVGTAGFGGTVGDMSREKALKALSDFLRPEFISRVDEVVVFNTLSEESLAKIAALMLEELRAPLLEKFIELKYSGEALSLLAKKSRDGKYAARDLRKFIRKDVEDKIASVIVERAGDLPSVVSVDAADGEITVNAK